jgi:mannan endo-1,4-beta-mannosidase
MHLTRTLAIAVTATCASLAPAQNVRVEAESGTRTGTLFSNTVPGYSGTGFVTDFTASSDKVSMTVNVPTAGLYELWLGYRSQYGEKGYGVQVNSEIGDGFFDTRSTFGQERAGLFKLNAGNNTIAVTDGWGYFDVDYAELRPSSPKPISPVPATLIDPAASANTHSLMNYLTGIYGSKTLAGQQGPLTTSYITKAGGVLPALSATDFMDYSPSRLAFGSNPNNESERMIRWAHQTGGVVSMMWHWNAPSGLINTPGHEWWRGFYTDSTTFDVADALAHPGGANYNLLLRDIDAISAQLKKFQDAHVPVLWRPLHEAQGGWFWWGAKGPDAFKGLWNLMYDRMTNVNGLHNLIWVYTSSDAEEGFQNWYPGDNKVDVVGVDVYTDKSSSMSGQWLNMLDQYNGKKLVTLSETGTLPNANLLRERNARWSYFNPWDQNAVVNNYTDTELRTLLNDADVITLNELPTTPWNASTFLPGDANLDGLLNADDYATLDRGYARHLLGWTNGDFNLDGSITAADYAILNNSALAHGYAGAPEWPADYLVPEPAGLTLLAAASLFLRRTRDKN